MASLSIDEANNAGAASASFGASSSTSTSLGAALETATPTVPCIPTGCGADKKSDDGLIGAVGSPGDDKDGEKDGKKKKNRCLTCKKKVGLTGFTCRCGGLFCSIHRYSDKHECGFDYKVCSDLLLRRFTKYLFQALGAEEISKSNPVVVAQKVAKI
jgi:hypothetical protein